MKPHTVTRSLLAAAIAVALGGCVETGSEADHSRSGEGVAGDGTGSQTIPQSSDTRVNFDPENQVIPFPNNLLFEAADNPVTDGTLNAPVDEDDPDSAALIKALNALNGFSTIASWRLEFSNPVDPDSLVAGETVRVFKLNTAGNTYPERIQGESVEKELVGGEDFEVKYLDEDGSGPFRMKIVPRRPLEHDTTYAAVVTDGVLDTEGHRVGSRAAWTLAKGSDRLDRCNDSDVADETFLQCFTNNAIAPVAEDPSTGLSRSEMIMGWGVTTQREDRTFAAAADTLKSAIDGMANEAENGFAAMHFLDASSVPLDEAPTTPGEQARVWPGTVALPYGLDAPEVNMDGAPTTDDVFLNTQWDCGEDGCNTDAALGLLDEDDDVRAPEAKSFQQVPAVMATPAGEPPEGGFPLVLFQHAIQQDRSTALAIADELAEQGYAVMAIDMPMHGMVLHQLDIDNPTDAQRVDLHATRVNAAMDVVDDDGFEGFLTGEDRLPIHHERTFYANAVDRAEYEGEIATEGIKEIGEDEEEVHFRADVDPSGEHFLVPDNPLLQRDIMRQAALDLTMVAHYLRGGHTDQICVDVELIDGFQGPLSWLIGEITDSGCEQDSFDEVINTSEIHFLGHSVGNIVAAPFLAYDQEIRSASFMAPTGGIMRTLEGSETIGPILREGLGEAGLKPGDEDYYRFFNVVSAAIDPIEPLNHADAMTTRMGAGEETEDRPIYMAQIVGNDGTAGTESDADLVLPPTVDGWATAGSTPLANAMGLRHDPVGTVGDGITVGDGETPLQTRVSFRYGDHASFLLTLDEADEPEGHVAGFPYEEQDYNPDLDPHDEMQRQVGSFLLNNGQQLNIGGDNPDMVEPQ